jgi:hypothetical protein
MKKEPSGNYSRSARGMRSVGKAVYAQDKKEVAGAGSCISAI